MCSKTSSGLTTADAHPNEHREPLIHESTYGSLLTSQSELITWNLSAQPENFDRLAISLQFFQLRLENLLRFPRFVHPVDFLPLWKPNINQESRFMRKAKQWMALLCSLLRNNHQNKWGQLSCLFWQVSIVHVHTYDEGCCTQETKSGPIHVLSSIVLWYDFSLIGRKSCFWMKYLITVSAAQDQACHEDKRQGGESLSRKWRQHQRLVYTFS